MLRDHRSCCSLLFAMMICAFLHTARAPALQMFLAAGSQLQMLVESGAWQHMNPPGFKRVHRALMYRKRPDGQTDVHRILANGEDVVKTRMLTALDKARAVQFFLWIERYDEADPRTHKVRPLSQKTLQLNKMSAAAFLAYWELPKEAVNMVSDDARQRLSVLPQMLPAAAARRCRPPQPQSAAAVRCRHPLQSFSAFTAASAAASAVDAA